MYLNIYLVQVDHEKFRSSISASTIHDIVEKSARPRSGNGDIFFGMIDGYRTNFFIGGDFDTFLTTFFTAMTIADVWNAPAAVFVLDRTRTLKSRLSWAEVLVFGDDQRLGDGDNVTGGDLEADNANADDWKEAVPEESHVVFGLQIEAVVVCNMK